MSAATPPPRTHRLIEGARDVQEKLRAAGLNDTQLFVATRETVPDSVHRGLQGGLISGARSLTDILDKLDAALDSGLTGIPRQDSRHANPSKPPNA